MVNRANNKKSTAIRIIAGRWKGRKLPVVGENIRPTGDRVRETLFNWLAAEISDARCLDLFAGTGALGLEALSRGAQSTVFVERSPRSAELISDCLTKFECRSAEVLTADALKQDLAALGPFTLVFLDPPFDGPVLEDLCTLLERSGALTTTALIYMEMDKKRALPGLPPNWAVLKEQTAGQVRYALARRAQHSEQE